MLIVHALALALMALFSGIHGSPPAHHHAPVVHPFDNGGMTPG